MPDRTVIEAKFRPSKYIEVTEMQFKVDGLAGYSALDRLEQIYGRSLRDYLQRLWLSRDQQFVSVDELMPAFPRHKQDPAAYVLYDSDYTLVVRQISERLIIGVEKGKKLRIIPRTTHVAEMHYRTVKANARW